MIYFNVPITKPLPLREVQPLINGFLKQKFEFALVQEDGLFALWRVKFKDESFLDKKEDFNTIPKCVAYRNRTYSIISSFNRKQ